MRHEQGAGVACCPHRGPRLLERSLRQRLPAVLDLFARLVVVVTVARALRQLDVANLERERTRQTSGDRQQRARFISSPEKLPGAARVNRWLGSSPVAAILFTVLTTAGGPAHSSTRLPTHWTVQVSSGWHRR